MFTGIKRSPDLITPKPIEPLGRKLRVDYRIFDISVPHIRLDGSGVFTFIGEIKPRAVPEHMRMYAKSQIGLFSGFSNDFPDRPIGREHKNVWGHFNIQPTLQVRLPAIKANF